MRDPTMMPRSTERTLEWLQLTLAAFCVGVGFFLWVTSPRSVGAETALTGAAMALAVLAGCPLLLVTSAILLFTNRPRAYLGFAALFLAVLAFSHSSSVMQ